VTTTGRDSPATGDEGNETGQSGRVGPPGEGSSGRAGAPPPNKGGYFTDPAGTGKTAWQYLTSVWSNCLGYFNQLDGFSGSGFGDLLSGGMRWADARGSAGTRSVDSYSHNGGHNEAKRSFYGWATRLSVSLIVECLASGMTLQDVDDSFGHAFPHEAVPEVLRVAAELTDSFHVAG
jgi:hypothetical protein